MRRIPKTRYGKAPDGTHIGFQVVGDGPVDLLFIGPALSHLDLRWEEPGYAHSWIG